MPFTNYSQLYQLEETLFIAGSNFTFNYNLKQENGVDPLNLTGKTVYFVLAPYGNHSYQAVQKTATITDATGGVCNVALLPADTVNLTPTKYIQQIVVYGSSTNISRPAQGLVSLSPSIPITV